MIEIVRVEKEQVELLRDIAIQTLYETFYTEEKTEVLQAYVDEAYTKEELLQSLDDVSSTTYFAYYDNALAGYLKVNMYDSQTEDMGDEGFEVQRIYVSKKFKGLRIGSLFMDFAIALAKANKRSFMWLGVWEHNYAAQAFYKKYGYYRVGEHDFTMGDLIETDWILRKDL
ncbi:acetyltransferase (GNAT) family protein [Breznakia blatticola]|uniref:Acetyltransferase (GNAT) family protein n=1 Tax=Breznakia blatticola TaxID=1754012 RepID=A0A4R7ZTE5_9FIRM|nr:acetyltransferase (GNAT) family protein [Breznakia blatticola]